VEMDDYRDAEDSVRKLDGYNLNGNRIIVEFSRGPKRGPRGPPSRSDYRVSIEGLPRDMSWQDLKDHFRKAGDVIFADVYSDRSGRHKGCVEFRSRDDMHRAVKEFDGTEIRGNSISVKEVNKFLRSKYPHKVRILSNSNWSSSLGNLMDNSNGILMRVSGVVSRTRTGFRVNTAEAKKQFSLLGG